MRFFRKLRSAVVVIPLPERSKCSRWTFWLRFSIVLMLLLARESHVNRFTSCNASHAQSLSFSSSSRGLHSSLYY